MSERVSFNLSINKDLKRLMQKQCAGERDVSEVTEQLYREYLKKEGVRIAEDTPTYRNKKKK